MKIQSHIIREFDQKFRIQPETSFYSRSTFAVRPLAAVAAQRTVSCGKCVKHGDLNTRWCLL